MKNLFAIAAVSCLLAGFASAEPTSRPTTKPAAASTIDKDSVRIQIPQFNAQYDVPKALLTQQTPDGVVSLTYWEGKGKDRHQIGSTSIRIVPLTQRFAGKTLAEISEMDKRSYKNANSFSTVLRDEATTLAGVPAWVLLLEQEPVTVQINRRQTHQMPQRRLMEIVCIKDMVEVQLTYWSLREDYPKSVAQFQRIADSLTWAPADPVTVEFEKLTLKLPETWTRSVDPEIPPGGQKFYSTEGYVMLTVFSTPPKSTKDWSTAPLAAAKVPPSPQYLYNSEFVVSDETLDGLPAKILSHTCQFQSPCGVISGPTRRIHAVALKDGKVYQLLLQLPEPQYEKRKAAIDALIREVRWVSPTSPVKKDKPVAVAKPQ